MAPEWTLAWAIQQWSNANNIAQEGGQGWTRAHGFFILMGGFHAFTREEDARPSQDNDPGTSWYPLDRETVITLIKEGTIELPLEEEIQDKGKTDWLGKTLVLLQTGWFVIQCAARAVAHLPLSEFEVVTLAYTIVNVGTYIAWWNKPRDVDRPIRVFMSKGTVKQEREKGTQQNLQIHGAGDLIERVLWFIFPGSDRRQDSRTFMAGQSSVPTFYSGRTYRNSEGLLSACVAPAIGAIFGVVHCIAWSYSFPSHTEQFLWRLASAVMIGVPTFIFLFFVLAIPKIRLDRIYEAKRSRPLKVIVMLVEVLGDCSVVIMCLLCPLLYGVARVLTFVLAFKTLTSLPQDAFRTIPWTKWIPHI
ncbi:hypothetical protein CPB86DRAFT_878812 [Serendipita vermifera]|nr:hypothetical protein CPB86DRAFT_878812 [Serendipita vermifera]